MKIAGKVALVTGASGVIGGAIAERLASEGAKVIGTYTGSEEEGRRTKDKIIKSGGEMHLAELDQRSPPTIDAFAESIAANHGRLDIMVNNAAWNVGIPFTDLDSLTPELWDRVLETNLRGPFLLARACAVLLKADGGGHIVNISSIGGITPIGSSMAYSAGKAGLNHLTRCLAVALAPEVAVNCVAPGLVENTGMSNRAMDPRTQTAAREGTLLGCAANVTDIAEQVLTLVSSRSITGQLIAIDGGVPGAMH